MTDTLDLIRCETCGGFHVPWRLTDPPGWVTDLTCKLHLHPSCTAERGSIIDLEV